MSLTELQTAVEASAPHPSLTIRARSPHPHEPPSPKCGDQGPNDVEMVDLGRNPSKDGASSTIVPAPSDPPPPPSAKARRKATIQFLALCWSLFTLGWNDGTTGPLLPRIQSVYHVRMRSLVHACHLSVEHVDRSDSPSCPSFSSLHVLYVILYRSFWSTSSTTPSLGLGLPSGGFCSVISYRKIRLW